MYSLPCNVALSLAVARELLGSQRAAHADSVLRFMQLTFPFYATSSEVLAQARDAIARGRYQLAALILERAQRNIVADPREIAVRLARVKRPELARAFDYAAAAASDPELAMSASGGIVQ